ncbi:MAG: hypothetical protein JRN05_03745 [Nitrososphaerota archaeon]|nr:hypothetical protein [Nitrososphaerota archaeon]
MKVKLTSRRRGVSELVGSLLAIAITIIAGAAVFGYVNTQAGVSERQLGSGVGSTVNYLQERFVVVDMYFVSSSQVTVYLYNNGNIALSPVEILLYNSGRTLYLTYTASTVAYTTPSCGSVTATTSYENPLLWSSSTSSGLAISKQAFQAITLALPTCSGASFSSGTTYVVDVVGLYGNSVTYYQTM